MAFSTQNNQINQLAYALESIRFPTTTGINIPHFSVRLLCTWAQAHHHLSP